MSRKTIYIFLFLSLTVISYGCSEHEKAAAQNNFKVEHRGAMREMFAGGDISGKIPVSEWTSAPHVFAIAPLENLGGEITVFDGKVYASGIRNGKAFALENKNAKAIFGVWTKVAKWQETEIPATVKTYDDLEKFVVKTAEEKKMNVAEAFPFLLRGKILRADSHINNYQPDGEKLTRERHDAARFKLTYENENLEVLGFYSNKHHGIFVHHSRNTHIHLINKDVTAHVDDLTLGGGTKLYLPQI